MKHVVLQRAWSDERATLGMIKILDHKHDPIFTLENPLRETLRDCRIFAGDYVCSPYSGTKFKDVYIVNGVPERTTILFHWGNFEEDTEGCILVGLSALMHLDGRPMVANSKLAMAEFRRVMGDEEFLLKVVDELSF